MSCPVCATDVIRKGPRGGPHEGDFTVCINCGEIRRFAADLTLYKPSIEELSESIIQAQMLIRSRDLSFYKKKGNCS